MKSSACISRTASILCLAALWMASVVGSGCSLQNLKDANRRLKESNDRLIAENNRLEEELAAARKGGEERMPSMADVSPTQAVAHVTSNDPGRDLVGGKQSLPDELIPFDPEVEVTRTSQGIRFRIPDRVFFSLGQATLSTRGQRILDKVSSIINKSYSGRVVRVDGHTDDTPIRKVRNLYPTNWELSSARACTVVRYLIDRGNVNARRIFPAGFAYYRPVATGHTPAARSQNRRVEITILNESA